MITVILSLRIRGLVGRTGRLEKDSKGCLVEMDMVSGRYPENKDELLREQGL